MFLSDIYLTFEKFSPGLQVYSFLQSFGEPWNKSYGVIQGTGKCSRVFPSRGTGGFPHHDFVPLYQGLVRPPQKFPENNKKKRKPIVKNPPVVNLLGKTLSR